MYFEAAIERVWRCTWRRRLCELRDAIGGRNCSSVEMHMETKIERTKRCSWRTCSIEIGEVLGGCWSGGDGGEGSQSEGGRSGGMCEGTSDSICWLTSNCGNVENWVQHNLLTNWLGAGDSWSWDNAVCGVCSTQCIQYSAYAVLGLCGTWCWLLIIAWRAREGWLNFVFLGDGRLDDKKEGDKRRWGKSSWESGTWENFVSESI